MNFNHGGFMEYQINSIIQKEYRCLKRRPNNYKTIRENYDHLFITLKSNGYNDFVAHQWTITTLSKIFGSIKVRIAVR
jgi:hypothetical protein